MIEWTPMVIDLGASQVPHAVFTVIHLAILGVAIYLTVRTVKQGGPPAMKWAFILIAVGEVSYIGYHMEITTFLLSHTLSEVLVLGALLLFFSALGRRRT